MKYIFICCDGTWNRKQQYQQGRWIPTNVALMSELLVDSDRQKIYYDAGVGTQGPLDKILGGIFAFGLFENIKQAYRYLVRHYEPGDRLVFLGFSRGAYTVRSLAGMIASTGILQSQYLQKTAQVFRYYRNRKRNTSEIAAFVQKFCYPQKEIYFLGVWDTVGSLGIPFNSLNWLTHWYFRFHNTQLSPIVRYAYQALAIDEHRRSFTPVLWQATTDTDPEIEQMVEQRWFAGSHSNIGGGYLDSGLSDLCFCWILERLQASMPDLQIRQSLLENRIRPDYRAKIGSSLTWLFPLSRIWPKYRQPLHYQAINEHIDDSVRARIRCQPCNYQPKNLKL